MSETLEVVADLRAFVAAEHEPGSLAARLAERLAQYLEHADEGVTLDEAFGLRPKRGGEHWWVSEARVIRDTAIRDIAETFPGGSVRELARQVAYSASRYQGARWRHDQEREKVDYQEPRNRKLHELMRATGGEAPNEETVRRVLRVGHEMGDFMTHEALSNTGKTSGGDP